jgi:phthalate 4,5-dioxygenase
VGIDPAHASFLHRFLEDEDPAEGYGRQFRDQAADTEIPMTRILREFPRPEIRVEPTDYGLRLISLRDLGNLGMHVRVTNQVFPHAIVIPMSNEMTITQWHVPVDDVSCYWYAIFTSFGAPVDKAVMRAQRLALYELPDYRPKVGKHNNYGFDPYEQATKTYTGMGLDINVHDQWAVESPGPIQDRTREHLGAPTSASPPTGACCARRSPTRTRPARCCRWGWATAARAGCAGRSPSTPSARPTTGRRAGRPATGRGGKRAAGRRIRGEVLGPIIGGE